MGSELPAQVTTAPVLLDARNLVVVDKTSLPPTPYNVNFDGVEAFRISPQEWVFVQEYFATSDPGYAYSKAFNSSPQTAKAHARKLLARPEIQEVLWTLYKQLLPKTKHKREVLMALIYREAVNDEAKPVERLKAMELWAKMDSLVADEDFNKNQPKVPSVNIYIGSGAEKPNPNVTASGPEPVITIGENEIIIKPQAPEIIDS